MKGLKGETPEIQDTLAQSMTGGSVRLEAETVLCETTEDEKQKKKTPLFCFQASVPTWRAGVWDHATFPPRSNSCSPDRTGLIFPAQVTRPNF